MDVSFTGDVVRLIATKASSRGIVSVSVDGGAPVLVDLYSPVTLFGQVVFEVSGLGAGVHTLSVVNTGTKNPLSTSARGEVDAIEAEALVRTGAAGGVAAV